MSEKKYVEVEKLKDNLWSAIRTLLSQGTDIEKDYTAGRYKSYEEFSACLDAAAGERIDWLYKIIIDSLAVEHEPVETDAIEVAVDVFINLHDEEKGEKAREQLEALKRRAG